MILTRQRGQYDSIINRCTEVRRDTNDYDFIKFKPESHHVQNKTCCLKYRMIPDNWSFSNA